MEPLVSLFLFEVGIEESLMEISPLPSHLEQIISPDPLHLGQSESPILANTWG